VHVIVVDQQYGQKEKQQDQIDNYFSFANTQDDWQSLTTKRAITFQILHVFNDLPYERHEECKDGVNHYQEIIDIEQDIHYYY
jgi:hypothetical protein